MAKGSNERAECTITHSGKRKGMNVVRVTRSVGVIEEPIEQRIQKGRKEMEERSWKVLPSSERGTQMRNVQET